MSYKKGFSADYCGPVVLDTYFGVDSTGARLYSTYIHVSAIGSGGDIVFQNVNGDAQVYIGAATGELCPISASKILTVGTVDGTEYATTAGGLNYMCSNLFNG